MQIHKLIIFLLLTTTQLIKSTEPTDNTYLFYTNHKNGFIDEKKKINQNIQQFFIFYLTDNEYDKNISINCNTHHKYYELKNKNTDIKTNDDTINIDFTKNTCEIIDNTNKKTITNFDIKDYPIIIFEVKEKESNKNSKFIYYIDSNSNNYKNNNGRMIWNGIFGNYTECRDDRAHGSETPYGIPWETIKIKKVFNKEKWTDIEELCAYNPTIKTFDFGDTELDIKDARYSFTNSNIKKVENLKNLFTQNLKEITGMFHATENLSEFDLDDLNLPEDSGGLFVDSNIKTISLNNTNMQNVKDLRGFIAETKVKNIDFSKAKNTENIPLIAALTNNCENLESIKLGQLINEKTKEVDQIFNNTPNLKTIDLSESKINKNLNLFDENSLQTKRNIILPNDEQSAKNCLQNIQSVTYGNIPFHNITYKDKTLENFTNFDDVDKFINDPDKYNAERNKIMLENSYKYVQKYEKLTEQLKRSNNKEKTLNEILKDNKLLDSDIKGLKKISDQSKQEGPNQQNNRKRGKFGNQNSNLCCKQCCCCCCK